VQIICIWSSSCYCYSVIFALFVSAVKRFTWCRYWYRMSWKTEVVQWVWSFYIIQTSYKVVNLRFSLRLCHVIAPRFASALQSNIFILAQVKWEWLWWPGGSRQLEIYILLFQLYFHFYVTMDSYNFYTLRFVLKIILIMPLTFPAVQSNPIVVSTTTSA